jgi:hypothetical protein
MNTYYIAFEKYQTMTNFSWQIRKTPNDMDTYEGLCEEIKIIQEENKCDIRITYWKKLKNETVLTKILKWCKIKLYRLGEEHEQISRISKSKKI